MRLIDADAAKRRVADTYFDTLIPAVNRAFDDSPTVDAVPVVRCKDCKNWGKGVGTFGTDDVPKCWATYEPTSANDFCSYGEHKEADNA